MRWSVLRIGTVALAAAQAGDLLVLPVCAREDKPDLAPVLPILGGRRALAEIVRRSGFTGKPGACLSLPSEHVKAGWVLLIGLGSPQKLSLEGLRRAAAVAARQARDMQAATVLCLPLAVETGYDTATSIRCWVEGAELALAAAGPARAARTPPQKPQGWRILLAGGAELAAVRSGLAEGKIYAAGCLEARRLVNQPPNVLTPRQLAAEARRLARQAGLQCTVYGLKQLRKLKLGGLIGVGQGSRQEAQLICVESRHAPAGSPTIALVGKGITFDSGGISLKPGAKMDTMKCDMAGAAAVLGAAVIVAERRLPARILAVAPAAENMPDGGAIRPSDVLTLGGGKTVEVLNTDAEGRLVLADALHWVCGRRPDYVVDIATLTGACATALGQEFAGVMGTSSALLEAIEQAGGETGERVWPLPLIDAHRDAMQSKVADLKNIGPREAGASTAAAFLSYFVPEQIPWAHIDIAGPAWTEQDGPLGPRGGTGFGARLLARMVEILVG